MNRKIMGFLAFFDILGFKNLIQNNSLEYLESNVAKMLDTLDVRAKTMDGVDGKQMLSFEQTESIVFSDTIILYERCIKSAGGQIFHIGPSIIDKSALLLRIAFEAGIPLRGAISFGEYVVSDRYILGKPIVEASETEKALEWSGAVLCKTAIDEWNRQLPPQRVKFLGMEDFLLENSPFRGELLVPYSIPSKNGTYSGVALRWDDLLLLRQYLTGVPGLSFEDYDKIHERVTKQFYAHDKKPNDEAKIREKINNTADFIAECYKIPISCRLSYTPPSAVR